MRKPWSRQQQQQQHPAPSDTACASLRQAEQDVQSQRDKLHEERPAIDRLKLMRERNGLAQALYRALAQHNGHNGNGGAA